MHKKNKQYFKSSILGILVAISVLFYVTKKIEHLFITLLVTILCTIYNSYLREKEDRKFNEEIDKISYGITEAMEERLQNLIYPASVINIHGDIIWSNKIFYSALANENRVCTNILNVTKGITLESLVNDTKKSPKRLNIKGKNYEIYIQNIEDINGSEAFLVQFSDVTHVKNNASTKESVVLVEVDNLSDVIKSMEEEKRPLLVAEIERAINSYATNLNAMIRKYESNKYVLSIEDKFVESQIKKKFEILDTIRDIDMGNKISVTLSIGVGIGGKSPGENHGYAISAKELALGRGGDQAVVKWPDKISFFGGNTKELEKRTRVRARVVARALKDLVYESSKVYIMGHKNPDMDCFGAAFGLASSIKQLGKPCEIILGNDTRNIEFFLNEVKENGTYQDLFISIEEGRQKIDEETLIIVVDVHNINYVCDIDIIDRGKKVVIIDHHRRSPDMIEGALLNFIEVYASSTSELVTEVIQYMQDKPKMNIIEAEALLAGIFVDTKNFIFKTGVRTFEAASFLRRLGADTIRIKKLFSDDLSHYIKKADTIKSAEVENDIAIATCPPETTEIVLAAQVADDLLNITGIQASFVFVRIEEEVYISARSLGDINVQVILEALGGGGHMTMAGAKLSNVTMNEAKEILKKSILNYLEEGE